MKDSVLSLWNSKFVKIFRLIIFVPLYFISLQIVYNIYLFGVEAMYNSTYFAAANGSTTGIGFIFVFIFFCAIVFFGSFALLPNYSLYTIKICPNIRVGIYIYTMMMILVFGMLIVYQIMNEGHLLILTDIGIIILNAGFFWGLMYAKKDIK